MRKLPTAKEEQRLDSMSDKAFERFRQREKMDNQRQMMDDQRHRQWFALLFGSVLAVILACVGSPCAAAWVYSRVLSYLALLHRPARSHAPRGNARMGRSASRSIENAIAQHSLPSRAP